MSQFNSLFTLIQSISCVISVRQGGWLPSRSIILVWAHQLLMSITNKQQLSPPKLLVYLLMYLVNKR